MYLKNTATEVILVAVRTRRYTHKYWQIFEVHSKHHQPIRVAAVSEKQAKLRARRKAGVDWLEVTGVFVVNAYEITYRHNGEIITTDSSGINEADTKFSLCRRMKTHITSFVSITKLSTLWDYQKQKGKDPKTSQHLQDES